MKKTFSILVLLLFVLSGVADTKLPDKITVKLPKKLRSNLISIADTKALMNDKTWGQSDGLDQPWVVYSDRDENVTYTDPDGRTPFDKLEFNEQLRIAKLSGDYALVYTEPAAGMYPKHSAQAKSRGWVPMKHLLLWSSCPTDEHNIYQKALIATNLDHTQKGEMSFAYVNPSKKDKGKELRASMDFYFIMKEENGLSLLATNYKMNGTSYQVLLGWVSKSFYVAWNQRSCLEPNWNKDDAEYFKSRGDMAKVYKEKNTTSQVRAKQAFAQSNGRLDEATMYRQPAGTMRFPILGDERDYYYCTAFGKADGSALSIEESNKANGAITVIDRKMDDKKTINIIIVIDGTSSMGDFYGPMQQAIQQCNNYFDKNQKRVRVGVVIYRDHTDGAFVTEYQPMTTPDDPQLKKFLKYCGTYGQQATDGDGAISSKNDRDYDEALYKGLEVALDVEKMRYSAKNSNIMFVVGDCGNHEPDPKCLSQEAIIRKMIENNIQLSAFQVRNLNDPSFGGFVSQMNAIIKANMNDQYGKLGVKAKWNRTTRGMEFAAADNASHSYFMGGSYQAGNGQNMTSSVLQDLIQSSFANTSIHVDKWLGTIGKSIAVIGDNSNGGGTIDEAYLDMIYTPEEKAAIKLRASVMATNGYAPKKDASEREYWKLVLYVSKPEFQRLLSDLKPVVNAGDDITRDRKPFVDALKALARTYVGDKEIDNMSLDELMNTISGVIYDESSVSNKYKITDYGDKDVVSDEEFVSIVRKFIKKYEKLETILNMNNYVGYQRTNSSEYYWLPGEDMP